MSQILKINRENENFPECLKNISDTPESIYIRGEILEQDKLAIAIVGSRKCTSYGRQLAYDFAYELAKNGITIVSGLALGIDGEAHKGALDAGGRTLAVLGSGIDEKSIYPYSHKSLAERVLENGALISEYETGTPALPHHFPERNRIVSGLSLGVLIVEAGQRSGSLITANLALEQGKDIFATPGSIFSPNSFGTNKLIQDGAKLVLKPKDILESLEMQGVEIKNKEPEFSEDENKILLALQSGENHINDIIQKSQLASHAVLTAVTMLELKGAIKNIGNNAYVKSF